MKTLDKKRLNEAYWTEKKSINMIAKELNCSAMKVYNSMVDYNIPRRNRPDSTSLACMNPILEPSEDMCYILGVLKGDGSVFTYKKGKCNAYVIKLDVTNKKFSKRFLGSLKAIGLNPTFYDISKWKSTLNRKSLNYSKNMYRVEAYSKIFFDWYKKQDMPNLEKIVFTSKKSRISFIRGFFDSEGNISSLRKPHPTKKGIRYTNNQLICRACNTRLPLIQLFKKIMDSFGFKSSIYLKDNKKSTFKSEKIVYVINILGGEKEIKRFVTLIKPTFKTI